MVADISTFIAKCNQKETCNGQESERKFIKNQQLNECEWVIKREREEFK